jgi:hypothetical protein
MHAAQEVCQDEKLSGRIVFRARPGGRDQHSLLLREATYDTFKSFASIPAICSVSRKNYSRLPQGLNPGSWQLATETNAVRSCTIAQTFKGTEKLLKLPGGACQVDNLEVARADINDF